ncbi:MAG: BBP7 family outer membrane beta-barrel protein, partial [Patescibacteria group bacterium]|nr:BBP7 family outer membrane beta-barrel protein [Patescibacteria group bacterium]
VVGTDRLLLGTVLCCIAFGAADTVWAQGEVYNTIRPVPEALKEAVYPFTMPFTNLVKMTRWNWDGCGPDCLGCPECKRECCPCGPDGRFWARADYLMWSTAGASVPALVTSGTLTDPVPNTSTLFGDRAYNDDIRHQYRFRLGYWFGDCRRWAIQSDWLDLGTNSSGYSASSNGNPILTRPFYDVLRQLDAVQVIAYPNLAAGSVDVRVADSFHSVGASLRRNLFCRAGCDDGCGTDGARLDLFAGYRHYQLNDSVAIGEHITLLQGSGGHAAGTQFNVHDSFRSGNEFHGAEIGLVLQRFRGPWSFEAMGKLAIGGNRQTVTINGETVITPPGGPSVLHAGGLLALDGTNINTYQRDSCAVIPHFGFEVGYQLTYHSRIYMGYDFMLWTGVKRAGEHIDTRVNTSYMPPQTAPEPPALPAFAWRSTDFWA